MDFSWPDPQSWQTASAVATCVAVIITMAGLLLELRARRIEGRDRAAAQARLVFEDPDAQFGSRYLDLHIKNHSTEPVHAVEIESVWCRVNGGPKATDWSPSFMVEGARTWTNSLAPGGSVNFTVSFADAKGLLNGAPDPRARTEYELTFSFMDSQGVRWRRRGLQSPVRINDRKARWTRDRRDRAERGLVRGV